MQGPQLAQKRRYTEREEGTYNAAKRGETVRVKMQQRENNSIKLRVNLSIILN